MPWFTHVIYTTYECNALTNTLRLKGIYTKMYMAKKKQSANKCSRIISLICLYLTRLFITHTWRIYYVLRCMALHLDSSAAFIVLYKIMYQNGHLSRSIQLIAVSTMYTWRMVSFLFLCAMLCAYKDTAVFNLCSWNQQNYSLIYGR